MGQESARCAQQLHCISSLRLAINNPASFVFVTGEGGGTSSGFPAQVRVRLKAGLVKGEAALPQVSMKSSTDSMKIIILGLLWTELGQFCRRGSTCARGR